MWVGNASSRGFEVLWWLVEIDLELLVDMGLIWVLQRIGSHGGDGLGF